MVENMDYHCEEFRIKDNELLVVPFNSKRKRMTTVVKGLDQDKLKVYVKGAPELLLQNCTRIISKEGKIIYLREEDRNFILEKILNRFAENVYRSLLLAYKEINSYGFEANQYETEESISTLETNLIIISIIGLEDPIRDDVHEAVKICKNAGITVRMVTGDDIEYAKGVALKTGIIGPEELDPSSEQYKKYCCMLGTEFYKLVEDS